MAAKCRPPKGVSVKTYSRKPPKRKRPSRAAPPKPYYECFDRNGRGCGVHHSSFSAASKHSSSLNRKARNQRAYYGKTKVAYNTWRPERRTP